METFALTVLTSKGADVMSMNWMLMRQVSGAPLLSVCTTLHSGVCLISLRPVIPPISRRPYPGIPVEVVPYDQLTTDGPTVSHCRILKCSVQRADTLWLATFARGVCG